MRPLEILCRFLDRREIASPVPNVEDEVLPLFKPELTEPVT